MFLLRIAFLVVLIAWLLPQGNPAGFQQDKMTLSGEIESALDRSQAEQLVIRTMRKFSRLCSDYPTVCEMRDSAIHVLRVQAVAVTGALHKWLKAGLEEQESA